MNNFGVWFFISILYLLSRKSIFDYFVFKLPRTDRECVGLVWLLISSNYDERKLPKYFIFLFRFKIFIKLPILSLVLKYYVSFLYYSFFASSIICYWENFFCWAYLFKGGTHYFCTNFAGYEIFLFFYFADKFKILLTLFSIKCFLIESLTLVSNVLYEKFYFYLFAC